MSYMNSPKAQPQAKAATLTAGQPYDLASLTCAGWTDGDGSGHEGYHVEDYFRNGVYLGPDEHGIEPTFERPATATPGDLHDYRTGEYIRPATQAETDESIAQAARDGGAGVIAVDGRSCYVEGGVAQAK